MTYLAFDQHDLTIAHDFWTWLWWEPGDTPRAGDKEASRRTRLRWRDISRLDATGPYPSLAIRYFTGQDVRTLVVTPGGELPPDFLERMRALFEHAARHLDPAELRSGWVDAEDLAWEAFDAWPADDQVIVTTPYRDSGDDSERLRAIRGAPSPFEAMLQWLASTPERPWKEHPRRVAVTTDYVCAERRDRALYRVRRERIRGRRNGPDGDRVYYFGRQLRLLLPGRDEMCPVIWALDQDCLKHVGPPD